MAAQADHLLTHVAAICEVSNFLGQSHRINLDKLSAAIEQFPNTLLEAETICISKTCRRCFDNWYECFDLQHALAQLVSECFTFLLAHLLQFGQRLVQRLVQGGSHSFVDAVACRLE